MVPRLPLRQRGSVSTVAAAKQAQDRERAPPAGSSTQRPEQRPAEPDSGRRVFRATKYAGLLAVIYGGASIAFFWYGEIALGLVCAYLVYVHIIVALSND